MRRRPITIREIEAGRSPDGGFTLERLRAWGVRCPPKAGWKKRLIRSGVPASCSYPDGFAPPDGADVPINPLLAFAPAASVVLPADAVEIFADGSCRNGAGGWGFAAYRGAAELHSAFGSAPDTTNNRMELAAVIEAVRWLDPAEAAVLWTDSQYVFRGVAEWRHGWNKANWARAGRPGIANADLWRALYAAIGARPVDVRWLRGHAGTAGNKRADELAARGREKR